MKDTITSILLAVAFISIVITALGSVAEFVLFIDNKVSEDNFCEIKLKNSKINSLKCDKVGGLYYFQCTNYLPKIYYEECIVEGMKFYFYPEVK